MTIRWVRLAEAQASRYEAFCERERFAYVLAMQYGREVSGDGEDRSGADGARAICVALAAATGLAIRATPERLMNEVFTERNPPGTSIQAAFLVTRKDRSDGERIARKGTATHVAGVVGRGVVLSFEHPRSCFRTVEELWTLCGLWDYDLRLRGLDREALARVAGESATAGDTDVALGEYLEEVMG